MYCDKVFKHKTHLYRHQKYRCKVKSQQESETSELAELKQQISKLVDANLNNSKTMQKSMSAVSYIMQNFKDAPPIGLLKGKKLDGFIEYNG